MDYRTNYKRILESGRQDVCECCGLKQWQGKEIRLQVHHVDGNRKNNELSNLQLLCPNCHSQTDNLCSKNRKKLKEKFYCKVCGKEITENTKTGMCRDCYNEKQKPQSKCPEKDQLISDCKKLGSYLQIAKLYKVSDKTIRKWCDKYNINIKDYLKPKQTTSIKNILAIKNKYGKPIYQFDLFGKFIKEYPSIREAERQTGITTANIRKALRNERNSAGGFVWKLKYGN